MPDAFADTADQITAPATRAVPVTPDDAVPLPDIPKALFVGTGGTLVLRGAAGGADAAWRNVPSGSIVPLRARFVRATGTTAADILALY